MILIIAGLQVCWMAPRAGAQAVPEDKGGRPLLFLGNQSLPPMSYLKNDEPAGVVVDLARALAKRMDRPVEIRLTNWSEAQRQVLDGQADALLQINSSPERLKIYDFSEPLLSSEFTIFTASQRQGIASMEDLRGLKVGVEEKGLPISLLKQEPQILVEIVSDFAQGLRMLTGGGLDAVVADRWVGSYVLAENDIRGVKLIDSPISRSHSAIAVKKGNRLLLDAINQALAGIRQDGTYDRIIHSWEPKEIVFKTREQLRQQAWMFAAISALLIVALVGIALAVREIRRRKHVEAKLRESEERLRFALDAARFGTFDFNPQTGGIIWDAQMKQIWGVAAEENILYSEVLGRVHPEDQERVQQIFTTALSSAGDGTYEAEYRICRPDGSIRWTNAKGRVHFQRESGHRQAVRVIGIEQDITERKQSEIQLERSHREKIALLQEVHHRVKNNLQVVASLVGLQTYGIKSQEALDILKDTRNRVCSMALLHEVLYRSKDLARIGFSSYLHDLCRHIVTSFGGAVEQIKVETRAEDIGMPMDKAVPCGLLVNELVSNALKHAFPGDRSGSVVVELAHSSAKMLLLRVQDDGVGLPSDLDLQNTPTLGLQLVFDLARQLLGHVTVSSSPGGGTVFSVAFPLAEEAHRGGSE